jgi:hypothetical protein
MARPSIPREEYLHTRDWLVAAVAGRLRLPWLPFGVRLARTALVLGCAIAATVAAVVAGVVWTLTGVGFWSAFAVVFGIVLGWLAWKGLRFWRLVRRGQRELERHMAELRIAGWRVR